MLRYAMLRYAMLRYAALRYAMLCYATLWYAMLRYATLCYAMLCYATLCYAMRWRRRLRARPTSRACLAAWAKWRCLHTSSSTSAALLCEHSIAQHSTA
jgi:hypothetical protein